MLTDARTIPSGTTLTTDVCIVGAGPAGLTLADELKRRRIATIVLEAGGDSGIDPETDDLLRGEANAPKGPLAAVPYPLHTSRAKGIGGASLRWNLVEGWRARALDPIDFENRPGVPDSGWPFSHSDLLPYFRRARAFCGLEPDHDDPEYWANGPGEDNLLLHRDGVRTEVFFRTDKGLYTRRKDDFAQSETARLITRANVVEIDAGPEARSARAVTVRTLPGNQFRVEARTFVLAAGGIDNARLLLVSNAAAPRGLGNDHDLVGRYFMEHPHVFTGLLSLRNPADAQRMGLYGVREHGGYLVEGALALSERMLREHALPNAGFFLWGVSTKGLAQRLLADARAILTGGRDGPGLSRRIGNAAEDLGFCLDALVQRGLRRARSNNLFQLYIESEQVPNPRSRVTLGGEVDALGLPRAKLEWQMLPQDYDTIRRTHDLLDAELRRLGLGRLHRLFGDETAVPALGIGNHHIGTTRMSDDPRSGVVDADGRVHGIDNLYVTGSSIFPTGGAANPTLTIIALALRLADTLAKRHG